MKQLLVPFLSEMPTDAAHIHASFDRADVEWQFVATVNWTEYPYRPQVAVRLAYCEHMLFVEYAVRERTVRAVAEADNGPVWEDSCCELFLQLPGDEGYYNVECNCAGRLLVGYGKGREERRHAPAKLLAEVDRCSTLGSAPFVEQPAPEEWLLSLALPASVFFEHEVKNWQNLVCRGNVYKCGDRLSEPHFLSWSPIASASPDFHRPESFGTFNFQ